MNYQIPPIREIPEYDSGSDETEDLSMYDEPLILIPKDSETHKIVSLMLHKFTKDVSKVA